MSDIKWDGIPLNSLFTFERGKEKDMASLNVGHIPLVSARKVNNGIKGFIDNPTKTYHGGNVITLNNDGDGGAGLAFYQSVDFALDTHVTALSPRTNISPEALIYMSASISKQHAIFGHGRSISLPRAERLQDMLPVKDDGQPNIDYMVEYVQQRRTEMLNRYHIYIEKRLSELGKCKDIPALEDVEWGSFNISNLFHIKPGKRLVAADSTDGDRPFVGALDNNNGVARFVSDTNASLDQNVLGVNYNGNGMVIGFYHPYECIFSDDVKRFHLKEYEDNEFVLLFFKVVILQQKSKFGYLYKFNADRMENTSVMVPVKNRKPDYEYMEQYTRNMMIRKYQQYLRFLSQYSDL